MDPGFHFGFSSHVTQFPSQPNPVQRTHPGHYGPPPIGFDSSLYNMAGTPSTNHMAGNPSSYHMAGTPTPPSMAGTTGFFSMGGTPQSVYIPGTPGYVSIAGPQAPLPMAGTPGSSSMAGTLGTSSMACTSGSVYIPGPPGSSSMAGTLGSSTGSVYIPGTPGSSSMAVTLGTSSMACTSGSVYIPGPPGPSSMAGTTGSVYIPGTPGSSSMAGTPGSSTGSVYIPGPSAPPVSYGFVTNNWIDECQSWYPEPPPPVLVSSVDAPPDPEPAIPAHLRGFTIGFENFVDLNMIDPDAHYHHIAHPGELYLPTAGSTGALARSQTMRGGDCREMANEGRQNRRFSLYDTPLQPTQLTDCKLRLLEDSSNRNPALIAFCQSVTQIRKGFSAGDGRWNSGRLWSLAVMFPEEDEVEGSEVEVTVEVRGLQPPLLFLLRDTVKVEDLIADVLNRLHHPAAVPTLYPLLPDPIQTTRTSTLLRICGRDEYLQSGFSLRSHTVLQRRSRIRLHLLDGNDFAPPLARTEEDDNRALDLSDHHDHHQYWLQIRKRLFGAVSRYEENVRHFLQNQSAGVGGLLEVVKEICYLLRSAETREISEAVQSVRAACYPQAQSWTLAPPLKNRAQEGVTQLSLALAILINIYSRSFYTDFKADAPGEVPRPIMERERLAFHLYAAHNLPDNWAKSDAVFHVSCSVTYSGRKICPEVMSRKVAATHSLFSRLVWDEEMVFPLPLMALPYESMLVLRLCCTTAPHRAFLAWAGLPLYSQQRMVRGSLLLNMTSHAEPPPLITPGACDVTLPTLITIQLEFPETHHTFQRPAPEETPYYNSSSSPAPQDPTQQLDYLAQRNSVLLLSEADKQRLWHQRHCANPLPGILPLLLGSLPGWDPQSLSAMYGLLRGWTFSDPLEGLGLLNSCFSDEMIREAGSRQIGNLTNDELWGILPQLIQAVKFDWRLDSPLVKLLLQRSLQSVQIAHRLFWLLTDATHQPHYRSLYQSLLNALQSCAGSALNTEFTRQTRLIKILQSLGESVKSSSEEGRQEVLQSGLQNLERFFQEEKSCRLPLDPALIVTGIDRELCSYFRSNAKPLKITFLSADPQGPHIHVIFKTGDDIRQDALILQIIQLMDRIWLHEGLDLRMVTYSCLPTGRKQGLIQMVPDSTTLAKIQNSGGLLGPLRDSSMKKWFAGNKTASDNFLYSCAGWCVATFLLGVCDRHNDNLMLTAAGHLFHIDFGKILGHAQMFGKVKRDRAPFIFTSEMENFITEEGRSPERAQRFVDLCCSAYNILRRHSALIINMLELMLSAGLPELSGVQDLKYVHDNLRPYDSDLQATSYFTSKISESLQCVSVKLNFLIHAFANMTSSDAAKLTNPSLQSVLRSTAKRGLKIFHRVGDRILNELGPPRESKLPTSADRDPGIQLHFSFSLPKLSVLVKHLRNMHLPDGSAPAVSVTVSLHQHGREISQQKFRSQVRSSAPTFNKLVEFSVWRLDGLSVRFLVKSKGSVLGDLRVQLSGLQLDTDVWYRLGG